MLRDWETFIETLVRIFSLPCWTILVIKSKWNKKQIWTLRGEFSLALYNDWFILELEDKNLKPSAGIILIFLATVKSQLHSYFLASFLDIFRSKAQTDCAY